MQRKQRVKSNKLIISELLQKNKQLVKLIPETKVMNRHTLKKLLSKYNMVYIKPFRGHKGKGVMKVERVGRGDTYRIYQGTQTHRYVKYGQAYRGIMKLIGAKPYIVQRGIRLLTYEKRPFDIRVMVQRNRKGRWEATGYVGRVAHPHKVVTNGSQGGTIYPVEVLLSKHMNKKKRTAIIAKMNKISIAAARQYSTEYPLKEIGADIAIDQQHRLWILELNKIPDPCPFTKLNDLTMIRRIIRYGKAYGRKYALKCTKSKKGM